MGKQSEEKFNPRCGGGVCSALLQGARTEHDELDVHRIAEGIRGQVFRRRPDHIPGRASGQEIAGDRVAVRARMRLHGAPRCQPTAVHETSSGYVDVGCKYCASRAS